MKKTNLLRLAVPSLCCFILTSIPAAKAATIIWTNTAVGTAGDWNGAANWSPNQVPGAGDNAFITNNGTYTVGIADTTSDAVNNLTLGGTSGTQTLDIAGVLVLNGTGVGNAQAVMENNAPANTGGGGGNLNGSGTLTLAGPMTWLSTWIGAPGTAAITLTTLKTINADIPNGATFSGGTWINTGTITMTGPLAVSSGSVFSNAPGATVVFTNIYTAQSTGMGGSGTFVNAGELLACAPDGLDSIGPMFINAGTVIDTNGDVLTLSGGGTNAGSISIGAGSIVETTNGVYEFLADSTVSGGGTFEIVGTNASLAGTISCNLFSDHSSGSGVSITGAMNATTSSFQGNATFSGGATLTNTLALGGGTVNFNGTGAIQPTNVTMSGGTLAGTGSVLDSGTFEWTGGTISGILQCDGGTISYGLVNNCDLLGGELINTGIMTVQDTYFTPNISQFTTGNGGIVSNTAAASFNFIGGTAGTVADGASIFYNAGTLTFTNNSTDAATFTIQSLVNTGTVTVNTNSTLVLANGATNQGQITEGLLSGASLPSGSYDFLNGSTFSVPDGFTFNISSATATFAGTLDVGGPANFESGTATFTGGGTFTNAVNISGALVNFNGANNLIGPMTNSNGTANFNGGGSLTGTLLVSGGTVNFDGTGTMTPSTFNMNNGTEEGSQAVEVLNSGGFTWNGGTIYGTVDFNGGSIPNGGNMYGTFVNSGTLTWNGSMYFYGGHLTNLVSGTVNLAAGIYSAEETGTPNIDNDGQFNATGPGTTSLNVPFNNYGTVTVSNNGTLALGGGGTESGSFMDTAGSTLEFDGGTFAVGSGSTISAAGNFMVNGGTVNLAGVCNVTGTSTFSSGIANVTGACNITNALVVSGGTLNLNGTGTITPPTFTISNGAEEGSQNVQVLNSGGFTWSGGSVYNTVLFDGGSIPNGGNLYGTFVNSGTLAWNGSMYFYGGHLTNLVSGTVNLAAGIYSAEETGTPNIDNDGQFDVTGPGTTSLNVPFNNSGTVTVSNNGTLALGGGGTENGSFMDTAGSTLEFDGGTFAVNSGSTISAAGNFMVNGGTVNLAGVGNVTGTSTFSGGTANVTGAFNITNALVVSGGTLNLNGTGTITPPTFTISNGAEEGSQNVQVLNSGGFTWSGGSVYNTVLFDGGSIPSGGNLYGIFVNSGTLAWNGSIFFYGGQLTNSVSGTVNLTPGTSAYQETGTPSIDNNGQFNATGPGASTINLPFNNTGTVTISNSGTLALGDGGTESGAFTNGSGSTLNLGGGAFTFSGASSVTGAGNFSMSSGTASLGGTLGVTGTNTFSGGTANVTGIGNITTALVISGGTLNLTGSGTVTPSSLNISGGTEEGSQTMQVNGPINWSSGNIDGTVQCNGGSVTGGELDGGTLLNANGTLAWSGSYIFTGGGSLLTNLATGTINLAAGTDTQNIGGGRTIGNAGQFTVAGAGTSPFSDTFNNTGTVTVNSGTLQLNGGGTEAGLFTNASGGTLNLGSGTFTFTGASSVTGAGNFTMSGGTAGLGGTLGVTGTNTFSGGTANVTGIGNITTTLVISGGTLNLTGGGTITPSSLNMSSGTEEGSQTMQVNGPINWSGGTIEGQVQCNGGSVTGGELDGGTLLNSNGTLAWSSSYIFTGGGSLLTNLATGTINLAAGTTTQNIGGSRTIGNAGQFTVSGAGTSAFSDAFNNTGTVTVSSGTLQLNGGGAQTGLFTNAASGVLNLNSGTYTFSAGSSVTGAGNFTISGATANFSGSGNITAPLTLSSGTLSLNGTGTITPASVTISGGTEQGSQTLQASVNNTFTWSAGNIDGTVQCNGGSVTGGELSGGTLLNSNGTLAWSGPYIFTGSGSLLTNLATGTINLAAGTGTQNTGGGRIIGNAGQFTVAGAGTSIFSDTFINTGTVTVSTGTLQLDGGGAQAGLFTNAANGALNLNGGTYTFGTGSVVKGAGNFDISGATANFSGSANITGPVVLSSGTLNLTGSGAITPSSFTFSSGTEQGSQTLQVNGPLNWSSGNIDGTVQCNGGSMTGGELSGGTLLNASGTLAWSGPYIFTGSGSLLTNLAAGTINLAAGTGTQNTGGVRTIGNAGQFTVSGAGTSTFSDTFINTGAVNIQGGAVSLTGAYSLTNGTLNFGVTNAGNFGTLNLPGAASLTGTLELTFDGYTPLIGDSFGLISYGSEKGVFTTFKLPPGISWQQTYGSTLFSLSVASFVDPTNVTMVIGQPVWATNGFNLEISGPISSNYTVQFATNLAQVSWGTLTNYVSISSLTSLTDTGAATTSTNRFYRAFIH